MSEEYIVALDHVSLNYHSLEENPALKTSVLNVSGEFIGIGQAVAANNHFITNSRLIRPTSGHVYVNGREVEGPSSLVGYMLQQDHLFDWRSIRQNVLLGLEIQGKLNEDTIARADRLLETYGLGDFKNHYPKQLSGGMRQRVALIRTLAVNPEVHY